MFPGLVQGTRGCRDRRKSSKLHPLPLGSGDAPTPPGAASPSKTTAVHPPWPPQQAGLQAGPQPPPPASAPALFGAGPAAEAAAHGGAGRDLAAGQGVRVSRAGGPHASPSLRARGTKWRPPVRGCPGNRPPLPSALRPPGGAAARAAPSHKTPRRRPAGLFPASVMAVSSGGCGLRPGCVVSIRRHPPSAGPGRAAACAGGSRGGREGELRGRCGRGGAGGPPWGSDCYDRPRPAWWLSRRRRGGT